jgi:glycine cleavage system H protein
MDDIGGVSFISLPEVSSSLCSGEVAVVVESSKAAIDCEAPLSGTVVAINESLVTHPHVLYEHPEDEGWLYRVESIDEKEWEACSHSCTPSER